MRRVNTAAALAVIAALSATQDFRTAKAHVSNHLSKKGGVTETQVTQAASNDLRGIYVYSSNVATISPAYGQTVTQSLAVSGVDGIVLVIGWNAIEPAMGQYQWGTLDQWMNQAVSSGKKINLAMLAGVNTPAWLFQPAPGGAGAAALTFTVSPHSGATGVCDTETIAPPWDPGFLSRWDSI